MTLNGKCEDLPPTVAAMSHCPAPFNAVTEFPVIGHKSGVYDLKVTGAPDPDLAEKVST